ncbi:MAG: hypothetical protein ACJAZS_000613 [Alteromonas naphthalenivorans]|jgi:hypothetical protein
MNKKLLITLLLAGTTTILFSADRLPEPLLEAEETDVLLEEAGSRDRFIPERTLNTASPFGLKGPQKRTRRSSSAPSFSIPSRTKQILETTEDITIELATLKQLISIMQQRNISTPNDNFDTLTKWILSQDNSKIEVTKVIRDINLRITKAAKETYEEFKQLPATMQDIYQDALTQYKQDKDPIVFFNSLQNIHVKSIVQRPQSASPRSGTSRRVSFSPELVTKRYEYSPTFFEYCKMHGTHKINSETKEKTLKTWFKEYKEHQPEENDIEPCDFEPIAE